MYILLIVSFRRQNIIIDVTSITSTIILLLLNVIVKLKIKLCKACSITV